MKKVSKYYYFILAMILSVTSYGQYLCDHEYKVINKQKKKIRKKVIKLASDWVIKNRDSLNLPEKLKFSKVKFKAKEDEIHKNPRYNKWREIDSLLCIKIDPKYAAQAKKKLIELNLVVYHIRSEFNFKDSPNPLIKSQLYFDFNFSGDLIRAVVRKKKMSPLSEMHYR